MTRLIVSRVLTGLGVIYFVATFGFIMLKLAPGGPLDDERQVQPHIKRNIERQYDLDLPVTQQYTKHISGLLVGDFGQSHKRNNRVWEIIAEAFPQSAQLGALSLLFACLFGIFFGVVAASKQNTAIDHGAMAFALFGISIPSLVLGPLLIWLFSIQLGWFPPALWEGFSSMILPAATLGMIYMGVIARLARSGLLETLHQDYIRTARAKGLDENKVVWKHAFRLGMMPVVTYLGPAAAALVTGSFVVEQIFQIPGLGFYFIASIADRDFPLLIGLLVFYSMGLVLLNLIVDITYGFLDPRIRERR